MSSNPRETGRRRIRRDGEQTHAAILDEATRVASVEGVHGLTIGRLADALGVSKSGLYAHFGSKEQLQIETIEAAQAIFFDEVVEPALNAPVGLARVEMLVGAFMSYVERWVFPGGCFFATLLAEADARTGPIHDLTVEIERGWAATVTGLLREARECGEVGRDVDPEQAAFELTACLELTNYLFVLYREKEVLTRGRAMAAGIIERARAGVA